MRRCDVYKKTSDDWYPPYSVPHGPPLVRVTFTKLVSAQHHKHHWRVCVWGMDDCGVEKDFVCQVEAWACFLGVIALDDVTKTALKEIGFINA